MPKRAPKPRRRHRKVSLPAGSAELIEGRLFMTGRSQALRLPAAFRLPGDSVYLKKWHGALVVIPKNDPWRSLLDSIGRFPEDFMADWEPLPEGRRPDLEGLFD